MKIKWSGIGVTDGRGAVGGNVASRNASGAYVRKNTMPVNPATDKQAHVRAVLASFVQKWRMLTLAEQNEWTASSPNFPFVNAMGETQTYTGQQLFNKLNSSRLQYDMTLTALMNPPAPPVMSGVMLTNLTDTMTAGALTALTATLNVIPSTTDGIVIFATPPLSTGISRPPKSAFRMVYAGGAFTTTVNFISGYTAVFPATAVAGMRIFVRIETIDIASGKRLPAGQLGVEL